MKDRRTSERRRRLIRDGGWGGGGSGPAFPPIVLTWLSDGSDTTPDMELNVPPDVLDENDHWEIRFYDDAGLTTQVAIAEGDVNATDAGDGVIDDTLSTPLTNGIRYARARVFRLGVPITQFSNTVSVEITGGGDTDDDDYAAWMAAA